MKSRDVAPVVLGLLRCGLYGALLLLAACTPLAPMPLSATYTILCASTDNDFEYMVYPCCSAFALEGKIVTTAHCVAGVASVRVVSRDQWNRTSNDSSLTYVSSIDRSRDFAVLGPSSIHGLGVGAALLEGAPITALTRAGTLTGHAGKPVGPYYPTDLDTQWGDSGSPVLDASGHAVGMVRACEAVEGVCLPHTGIIAGLSQ